LGYYPQLQIEEKYPITFKNNFFLGYLQDLTAPFFQVMNADYNLKYMETDSVIQSTKITLQSSSRSRIGSYVLKEIITTINLNEKGISEVIIQEGTKKSIARCVEVI
jgi:hypothetical protein